MSKSKKKPVTMRFRRSYKSGNNGYDEIKAIAKEFGRTPEQVVEDINTLILLEAIEKKGNKKK